MAESLEFTLYGDNQLKLDIQAGEVVNERFSSNSIVTGSGGGTVVAGYGGSSMKIETAVVSTKEFWIKLQNGLQERVITDSNIPFANGHEVELIKLAQVTNSVEDPGFLYALLNKSTRSHQYFQKAADGSLTVLSNEDALGRLDEADLVGVKLAHPDKHKGIMKFNTGALYFMVVAALAFWFFSKQFWWSLGLFVGGCLLAWMVLAYKGWRFMQLKSTVYPGEWPSQWALNQIETRLNLPKASPALG